MMAKILIYVGSILPLLWGISHLFPTKSIVKGFGDISEDNKNIITMEWIIEGIALIFVGVLVAVVTFIEPGSTTSKATYITVSCFLLVLSVVSLFTGFRINFIPFKLCPVIFTSSAVLISVGWMTIG
jgi:hypothetical protein